MRSWDRLQRQLGLPWWLSGKECVCNAGDVGLIPGSGKSPGEGHDNPLQYSYLGNPKDRGACQATVYGVAKHSDMTYELNDHHQSQLGGERIRGVQFHKGRVMEGGERWWP